MKVFFIALFILCINIALAVVSETDLFPETKFDYDRAGADQIKNSYETLSEFGRPIKDSEDLTADQGNEDKDRGGNLFTVLKHTLFPNTLLVDIFGLDRSIALWFSIPIYLFYIIGIAELFIDFGGKNAI